MENQNELSGISLVPSHELAEEEETKSRATNSSGGTDSRGENSSSSNSPSEPILRWLAPSQASRASDQEPPLIKNHTMTFYQGKLYIFGGYDSKDNHKDLYEFSLREQSWKKINARGQVPSARNGHTASLYKNKLFVVGGWLGSGAPLAASDLYELDLDTFRWSVPKAKGKGPGPCNMHTSDFVKEKLFVFRGGDGKKYLNDLHVLNVETMEWLGAQTEGRSPPPRANHSSAVVGSRLFIFGGWDGSSRLNDFYCLEESKRREMTSATMEWSEILTSMLPTPRAGTTLTPVGEDKLFLFGGSGHYTTYYNDILIYDLKKQAWREGLTCEEAELPSCRPQKRAGHSVAFDRDRKIYVFGGSHGQEYLSGVSILDTDAEPTIEAIPSSPQSLVSLLQRHYDNPQFSDIKVKCRGREFFAHKLVLSRNKYFASMFATRMRESSEAVVEFPFPYPVMASVLKYLYTDEFAFGAGTEGQELLSLDAILQFLDVSNYFLIEKIKRYCEMKLSHFVSPSTLDRVQAEAIRNDASKLLDYCRWYRRCVLPDILAKEQQSPSSREGSSSLDHSIESSYPIPPPTGSNRQGPNEGF